MVILNFSCRGLRDRDVLSKSDPQILLYTSVKDRANYTLVGTVRPSTIRTVNIFHTIHLLEF